MNELMVHAAKYYANILLLYSPLVQKLLADVQKMGLAIDMIAPDHGIIWRGQPQAILEAYDRWSKQITTNKAIVIYDTMWQSTEQMALAIADGLIREGISTKLLNLSHNHRSEIMTEALDAKAIICGSSTLNNNMLPRMADILTYMKGLKPVNRIGCRLWLLRLERGSGGANQSVSGRYEIHPGRSGPEGKLPAQRRRSAKVRGPGATDRPDD